MRYRPEYQVWLQMKGRCHNPNNKRFHLYGGRGIEVCQRWRESFPDFLRDMGERPAGGTLERVDNNKGYCPENCVWADQIQQIKNRRNTKWLTHKGVTKTLPEWSEEIGVARRVLYARIYVYGWSLERALTKRLGEPRKTARLLTHNGETKPMAEWARELGMNTATLKNRIGTLGWDVERALTTPVRKPKSGA